MKIFLLLVLPIITIAQYSIIKGKNEYDELNFSPEKNEYVDASIIAISKHEFSIFVMDEAEHTKFIVFGQPTSYNKEYSQEKVTKYQRRNMHFYERNYLVLMNQHNDHPINITYDFIKRKKKIEPNAVAEFFRDNWYWMLLFGIILGVPSFMCILCFTNLPGKNRTKIPGPMYVLCRYCWALFGNCIISLRKKWGKSNATNPPQTETYIENSISLPNVVNKVDIVDTVPGTAPSIHHLEPPGIQEQNTSSLNLDGLGIQHKSYFPDVM